MALMQQAALMLFRKLASPVHFAYNDQISSCNTRYALH